MEGAERRFFYYQAVVFLKESKGFVLQHDSIANIPLNVKVHIASFAAFSIRFPILHVLCLGHEVLLVAIGYSSLFQAIHLTHHQQTMRKGARVRVKIHVTLKSASYSMGISDWPRHGRA